MQLKFQSVDLPYVRRATLHSPIRLRCLLTSTVKGIDSHRKLMHWRLCSYQTIDCNRDIQCVRHRRQRVTVTHAIVPVQRPSDMPAVLVFAHQINVLNELSAFMNSIWVRIEATEMGAFPFRIMKRSEILEQPR